MGELEGHKGGGGCKREARCKQTDHSTVEGTNQGSANRHHQCIQGVSKKCDTYFPLYLCPY